jgi:MFS family permease
MPETEHRIPAWQLPARLMHHQAFRIKTMFRALKGNSRPLVKYDFLWALPIHFSMLYLRLFQREQGLTEVEIGTIMSFQIAAQILGALCGGYLAERFGRLRTVTWVDGLVWPATFFVFATAQGYLSFLAGAVLMGSIHLLVPSWVSLCVEGIAESRRPYLFAVRQLPWFVAMLTVSLSGFLVRQWGVSASCRGFFAFSVALTIFAVWYRGKFLKETTPPPRPFRISLKEIEYLGQSHWQAFRALVSRRHMLLFLAMQILLFSGLTTAGTFNYLYLTDPNGVGLAKASIAILPIFQGITTLLITFVLLPYVKGANVFRTLFVGLALMALSATLILSAPPGTMGLVIAAYICGSAGFAVFNPSISSHWSNLMNDRERARILALSSMLILIALVPIPTIAGGLYEINPRGPLFMILTFHSANIALVVWVATQRKPPREKLDPTAANPGPERIEPRAIG